MSAEYSGWVAILQRHPELPSTDHPLCKLWVEELRGDKICSRLQDYGAERYDPQLDKVIGTQIEMIVSLQKIVEECNNTIVIVRGTKESVNQNVRANNGK